MKKFTILLGILLSLLAVVSPNQSFSQAQDHVPGDFIIMLEKGVDAKSVIKSFSKELGLDSHLEYRQELSKLSNIHLFHLNQIEVPEEILLRRIQSSKSVRAAQLNHFVKERVTPNDPQLGSQWHHVDGSDNDIDSDLAWDITTGGTTANGDEIVVCVIEPGGANYNHTDLIDNHWTNKAEIPNNGVDDDLNGYIDDFDGWDPTSNSDNVSSGGHGTAVSGMIGAKGNNGLGGVGVNWDVSIMQVEVGSLTESNVIASYSYPQTMRNLYNTSGGTQGAFVVATNASWGIDFANPANYPVWCAYYDDLGSTGILNCGATANNNVNIDNVGDMPTACGSDYMVAVTATNSSDQRTFSGYGATSIDLAAPGESVYLPSGSSNYSNTSGTSFASPCVAGAIALVYSAPCSNLASLAISNPQLAADMVRGYIYDGVDPVAQLTNETVTGGRLNVKNALDLALLDCGPPPVCDPVGIALTESCELIGGVVEATISISASFDTDFCSAETVCYQPLGGSVVCVNLNSGDLSNTSSYSISGLLSSTTYNVYFTAADGSSSIASITTSSCSDLVLGCTDPSALNYDATADLDDGSCTYPCSDVTLTVLTDCWGNEVSWEILNDQGAIVASVSESTYDDQTTYTWSQCLEPGCYTFNIFDSFGDGMSGSQYSFCGVDGDYEMVGPGGGLLFEMGQADYGSGTTHTFCIDDDSEPPCADPYPQVTGLSSAVQANGVLLQWIPIPGSIGCQVQGGPIGGGSATLTIGQPEASQVFVSNGSLQAGADYQWRVRCACSVNPLIVGTWSPYDQFSTNAARGFAGANPFAKDNRMTLYPNPTKDNTQLSIQSEGKQTAFLKIFDLSGKAVSERQLNLDNGANQYEIDLSHLPAGLYTVNIQLGDDFIHSKLLIQ